MARPAFEITGARYIPGAVLGSPQSTTALDVRIHDRPSGSLNQAKTALTEHLPRWTQSRVSMPEEMEANAYAIPILILLSDLIQAVQLEAGIAVGNALPAHQFDHNGAKATIYLPTRRPKATEIAINWSRQVLVKLLDAPADVDLTAALKSALEQLKPFAERGLNNFFILRAAFELNIPVFQPVQGLLALGTASRSRWLQSLISDETPMLGAQCAQGKHVTAALLRTAGLPGGVHHLVTTREEAMKAAEALGYPVVVKPADADRGAGVAAGLTQPRLVVQAFDAATKFSRKVLVERWVPGNTHRLTVQDGQVIRVVRRVAGGVVGDGVRTIETLVELFQQTPQQQRLARRLGHQPLSLDKEALSLLEEQGLTSQSHPEAGVFVKLRRRDNVNAGGTNEEISPDDAAAVHPDNIRLAVLAAQVLRLDFAGIDFITTDIRRSWLELEGLICEVNAKPQMGAANDPGLYQGVLKRLFPHGATVPAELVLVPQDETQQAQALHQLMLNRSSVTVSMASGLWLAGQRCTPAFTDTFEAARCLLQRRDVTHAVCCMTVNDIHHYGLPMARWNSVRMIANVALSPPEIERLHHIKCWLQAAV